MEVILERDHLLNTLSHVQGIIEKRGTLPILSNVLIEAKETSVKFTSTDLDLIFEEEIKNVKVKRKGSTTISANIFYEIVRKCSVGSKIDLNLISENKLELKSENSKFHLLCLPSSDFPFVQDEGQASSFIINTKLFLKLSGVWTNLEMHGIAIGHRIKFENPENSTKSIIYDIPGPGQVLELNFDDFCTIYLVG